MSGRSSTASSCTKRTRCRQRIGRVCEAKQHYECALRLLELASKESADVRFDGSCFSVAPSRHAGVEQRWQGARARARARVTDAVRRASLPVLLGLEQESARADGRNLRTAEVLKGAGGHEAVAMMLTMMNAQ